MPAASGTTVVGKMSSRVLNMKFMQRKSTAPEQSDKNDKSENTENEKLHIKDTSEWSFGSKGKNSILATLKKKKLKTSSNNMPVVMSQTTLNRKYYNQEDNKDNLLIGKQKLGIKDELEKELENAVEEEQPKEKDLETLFKESNEMNKKSKKRKIDKDVDGKGKNKSTKKVKLSK